MQKWSRARTESEHTTELKCKTGMIAACAFSARKLLPTHYKSERDGSILFPRRDVEYAAFSPPPISFFRVSPRSLHFLSNRETLAETDDYLCSPFGAQRLRSVSMVTERIVLGSLHAFAFRVPVLSRTNCAILVGDINGRCYKIIKQLIIFNI
jgi:hypothetical protein